MSSEFVLVKWKADKKHSAGEELVNTGKILRIWKEEDGPYMETKTHFYEGVELAMMPEGLKTKVEALKEIT